MRRAYLVHPLAIWPAPGILVRRDDRSAPFAGRARRVGLIISDYRVGLVFVVDVLGFFRRSPQGLSFLFAILRSEVRPHAHSAPRIPALCRRLSPCEPSLTLRERAVNATMSVPVIPWRVRARW